MPKDVKTWRTHLETLAGDDDFLAKPNWGSHGDVVPFCSEECPHHDGKRCRLIGFRPSGICEPVVAVLANEYEKVMG